MLKLLLHHSHSSYCRSDTLIKGGGRWARSDGGARTSTHLWLQGTSRGMWNGTKPLSGRRTRQVIMNEWMNALFIGNVICIQTQPWPALTNQTLAFGCHGFDLLLPDFVSLCFILGLNNLIIYVFSQDLQPWIHYSSVKKDGLCWWARSGARHFINVGHLGHSSFSSAFRIKEIWCLKQPQLFQREQVSC